MNIKMDVFRITKETLRELAKQIQKGTFSWTDQQTIPHRLQEISSYIKYWEQQLSYFEEHTRDYEHWIKNRLYRGISEIESKNQTEYWVVERIKYKQRINKQLFFISQLQERILELEGKY